MECKNLLKKIEKSLKKRLIEEKELELRDEFGNELWS
jgi:hypothetical protein